MVVGKALTVMIKVYYCLPFITKNEQHSLKQVILITYTLEKIIVAAATYEGL